MDESEPKEEFKVTDKRRFTTEGESKPGEEVPRESAAREEPPPERQEPGPRQSREYLPFSARVYTDFRIRRSEERPQWSPSDDRHSWRAGRKDSGKPYRSGAKNPEGDLVPVKNGVRGGL
jgi:hypothetical protein